MFAINNKNADAQDSFSQSTRLHDPRGSDFRRASPSQLARKTGKIRSSIAGIGTYLYPIIMLTNMAILAGCQKSAPPAAEDKLTAEEGRKVFETSPAKAPADHANPRRASWSIVLALGASPDAGPEDPGILEALKRIQTKGGLPEAYAERRRKGTVIAYGRYPSADDAGAQADLRRIRSMVVDGGAPFADAFLSPPAAEDLRGSNPDLDLRNARQNHGGKRAQYTLQVAVYSRPDRQTPTPSEQAEFRAAAEKAAAGIRSDGLLAFYYHGPNSSSVTVGVFSDNEIDPKSATGLNPALRDAKEKFPHNLLNGKGVNEKVGVGAGGQPVYRLQASMLVTIPE